MTRALHVRIAVMLMALGLVAGIALAGKVLPFAGIAGVGAALLAGVLGAGIGWVLAGGPALHAPLQSARLDWAALGDGGLLKGAGCALGAVRRHAWAPWEILSHPRGHRLVLGSGAGAADALCAAASSWPHALIYVDTKGESARLKRSDAVRFAPGRPGALAINPLLLCRGGPHAWRDASILAAGLLGKTATGASHAVLAALLLDQLHTAAPADRTLDAVRRRLLDPEQALKDLATAVHERGGDGVWRAHPEIARVARVIGADPETARAALRDAERALRVFQDGRLVAATASLDVRLSDAASRGPRTIILEAPPGDGGPYGAVFAALLGQLVAQLTDAVETDAYGQIKSAPVLLAIDDPAAIGKIPLLAGRAAAAPRCGLELLVGAASIGDALALFGDQARLSVFDAIAAIGPLGEHTAAKLSAHAGQRQALRLRRGRGDGWRGLAPVFDLTERPVLSPERLQSQRAEDATLFVHGLGHAHVRALAAPRGTLRMRAGPVAPPPQDWTGPAAPRPPPSGNPKRFRPARQALPLLDADEEAGSDATPPEDADAVSARLRAGLARGARSRKL